MNYRRVHLGRALLLGLTIMLNNLPPATTAEPDGVDMSSEAEERRKLYQRLSLRSDTFSSNEFRLLVEQGLQSAKQEEVTASLAALFWKTRLIAEESLPGATRLVDPGLKTNAVISAALRRYSGSTNTVLEAMSLATASILFPEQEWVARSLAEVFRRSTNVKVKLDCLKLIQQGGITNAVARALVSEAATNAVPQVASLASEVAKTLSKPGEAKPGQ